MTNGKRGRLRMTNGKRGRLRMTGGSGKSRMISWKHPSPSVQEGSRLRLRMTGEEITVMRIR
jgi:hypothetical protein